MDDALVKELRGDSSIETDKYRSITDKYIRDRVIGKLNQIDAVLIVFTDDLKSQEMVTLRPCSIFVRSFRRLFVSSLNVVSCLGSTGRARTRENKICVIPRRKRFG
jgi:hypothetical protein